MKPLTLQFITDFRRSDVQKKDFVVFKWGGSSEGRYMGHMTTLQNLTMSTSLTGPVLSPGYFLGLLTDTTTSLGYRLHSNRTVNQE